MSSSDAARGPLGLPASLFTREDPLHLHKLLGAASLAHMVWRVLCVAWSLAQRRFADVMRFGVARPELPLLLLMHSALSLLSLAFHIPARRIKGSGSRIWPEYRLHSIIFAHRSLACMALVWADEAWPAADGRPRYWANVLVAFATLAGADLASAAVPRDARSPTIRGLEIPDYAKNFFTTMQFLATVGVLFGLRSHANYFMTVCVVQLTAFTFTLQRKNLMSHAATMVFYAFQLIFGTVVGVTDCVYWAGADGLFIFAALAAAAQTARILGANKYAVWAAMAAVVQLARRTTTIVPAEERFSGWPWWGWFAAYVAANVAVNVATHVQQGRRGAAAPPPPPGSAAHDDGAGKKRE